MKKNNGFTLIEVLVAVIVLAVGLLGLAGLQASGLKNNQTAYNRSQATQLAYDIIDRMRSNCSAKDRLDDNCSSAAANYLTSAMSPASAKCKIDGATSTATPCKACGLSGGNINSCTPSQLAEKDLFDWNLALNKTLPQGGRGNITKSAAIPPVYTVTVNWTENRSYKDGEGKETLEATRFLVDFQL